MPGAGLLQRPHPHCRRLDKWVDELTANITHSLFAGKFADRLGFYSDTPVPVHTLPHLAIDGPFGTSR